MEVKSPPTAANAPPHSQASIRSFFQPRTPTYSAPPTNSIAPPNASISPPSASAPPPIQAQSSSSTTLPQRASISIVEEPHIQPLRRINSLLLPVNYPDSFYHKILSPSNFSRVLLWKDAPADEAKVVGGVVCRLDPSSISPDSSFDIYVQSLALLSPYRSQGLATRVLETVISSAVSQKDVKIDSLYAHVWTENREALEWYAARGFKREEPVLHGYYRRLNPDTAWVLRRRLTPTDHLGAAKQSTTPPPPVAITNHNGGSDSLKVTSPGRPNMLRATSFQDRRPEREWNDLPKDLDLLAVPSGPNSRSSSTSRGPAGKKKKERQYPAAAFGA
ncbi:hypothetical protein BP6252_04770 [Coleophoma cylindrospora]|uniref:N-acetyltransferase domain-containing protein n=1 Tax=Coleophoma cylindrospora TaxID=1849047 RepID=A0A3D8S1F0_9HELO|nr:hypothetical protein BP6252_04770 [Coleophoma cylindrospora]